MPRPGQTAFLGYDMLVEDEQEPEQDLTPLIAARKAIGFKREALVAAKRRREELSALEQQGKSEFLQSVQTNVGGVAGELGGRVGGPGPRGRIVGWRNGYNLDASMVEPANRIVDEFGLRPSSGHRDAARNRAARGVSGSKHLTGEAFDATGSMRQMQAGAQRGRQMGLTCMVHDAGSGLHLHCQR